MPCSSLMLFKQRLSQVRLPFSVTNQQGVFSPFMFGLLMAVGMFSMMAMYWAKKDLVAVQEAQLKRMQAEAEDIAKAVEFTLRTETISTYTDEVTMDQIMQHTARSSAQTRGGEDMQLLTRTSEGAFEKDRQHITIASSDDPLTRSALAQANNTEDMREIADGSVALATVDTSAIRQQQIERSRKNLEEMGATVFQYYATYLRFPNPSEYDRLTETYNLKDVWGGPITYTYESDTRAILEFTTPWNYTYRQQLDLNN